MKIIDTHFHPDTLIEFENKKNNLLFSHENIITDSKKNMIIKMFCISTELNSFQKYINYSLLYQEYYFSIGIHPCELKDYETEDILLKLKKKIEYCKEHKYKLIGIGETGIDLFREEDRLNKEKQIDVFIQQILFAIKYDLPLIIHTRNATCDTYEIIKKYEGKVTGTIHAFCDDYAWAKKFIDLGFKLGIGGAITYPKNEHIRNAVKKIGIDYILLETDAPFLPIQSMRGKINHPRYCYDIGVFIADLLEINKELCFQKIYQNTIKLFNILY